MEYRNLGDTNLKVSLICLGTMTWGEQNTPDEGFEQMDFALENGVNFLILQSYIQYRLEKKPGDQQSL